MIGWSSFWRRNPTHSPEADARQQRDDFGSAYAEHHLTVDELRDVHIDSFIDAQNPINSDGLPTTEALKRLRDSWPNKIDPPAEISNLAIFFRQLYYRFWLLLLFVSFLSLTIYFAHLIAGRNELLNLICSLILITVVVIMCCITFYHEKKAIKVSKELKAIIPSSCKVIRDREERHVREEELVTGDIVLLSTGSCVPADLRILQSRGLKIETSAITGDNEPYDYTHEAAAKYISVTEARNVAFKGSYCVEGDGIGVVVRTGKHTMLGGISNIEQHANENRCRLRTEIDSFVNWISVFATAMAIIVFLVHCLAFKFEGIFDHFIIAFLIIIVANVPQGMPAMVIAQMSIIARRLALKNVFIKRLDIIDELGAATVIATDKTGTLTRGIMVCTDVWYNRGSITVCNNAIGDCSKRSDELNPLLNDEQPLDDIFMVLSICNRAQFESVRKLQRDVHKRRIQARTCAEIAHTGRLTKNFQIFDPLTGERKTPEVIERYSEFENAASAPPRIVQDDERRELTDEMTGLPSDVALLRFVEMFSSAQRIRSLYSVVCEMPFNSVRRYHMALVKASQRPTDQQLQKFEKLKSDVDTAIYAIVIKGAPEVVLDMCVNIQVKDCCLPLDLELRNECKTGWEDYGNNGKIVFGIAIRRFIAKSENVYKISDVVLEGLTFLGMAAIMDPPREDAGTAIKQCKDAGIKVYMITGDHPTTATAIARQIGLIGNANPEPKNHHEQRVLSDSEAVVSGEVLRKMNSSDWDTLLSNKYIVFARTTPDQKLFIVQECQRRNETVAVTGEGVSDVRALAHANIGLALGITGSDIAKKAADIILTDDNFASIVKGIEEGRLLFDNLRLSIAYTLAHLLPEISPVAFKFLFGLPLGLSPMQILSIDLASEMPPSISLAYELPERDIMKIPPRNRTDRLVTWPLLVYSYIFVGTIMTSGCTIAYLFVYMKNGIYPSELIFSADVYWQYDSPNITLSDQSVIDSSQQIAIKRQAASAWQITLVFAQVFHLYMCTTRRVSFFRHGCTSLVLLIAVIIELALLFVFVYTNFGHYLLETQSPPVEVWMFGAIIGVTLFLLNELRKFCIRRWPTHQYVRLISW